MPLRSTSGPVSFDLNGLLAKLGELVAPGRGQVN
jgi:hypothetical protein